LAAAAAVGYLAIGVRFRKPPRTIERRLFAWVNHHGRDVTALRVPQQLGTPWVLPGISVTAFVLRKPHLALVAGCALPTEKALEVGFKKILDRKRPAQADPDAQLHDDAPEDGPSYPSGHAAIASAAVFCCLPYVPLPALAFGVAAAGASSAVRIHQGAHFPMDAVGGVLLGLTVASGLTAAIGRRAPCR
jgi:membrane-associated phospholipid phosphatase